MSAYIVTLNLQPDSHDFERLLEEARLNFFELMREGKLTQMHVASNHTCMWLLMQAESPAEIRELLKTLPIYSDSLCDVQELEGE